MSATASVTSCIPEALVQESCLLTLMRLSLSVKLFMSRARVATTFFNFSFGSIWADIDETDMKSSILLRSDTFEQ